ncbi:hypothetical protein [Plantibacter sp. YIM 135347]|uniref:hypothetical protein n=1 Tax=Plantibacter sp. YIM 135347 TaxID=3423919 RepID=UPI003D32C634
MTNISWSRSRLTPRNVLVWGVVLVAVGVLLLPGASGFLQLFVDQLGATGHLGIVIITILATIVEKLALPLGIGFVCAAIVMFHVDRTGSGTDVAATEPEQGDREP